MKAHAKIRFNIYINIDAIGAAEYFCWGFVEEVRHYQYL